MAPHKIVSRDEWLAARKAHLAREKELTRLRDHRYGDDRFVEPTGRYQPPQSSDSCHGLGEDHA
jgi:predicted dithiol-disulfide oxidoreductase (DUF899 family)